MEHNKVEVTNIVCDSCGVGFYLKPSRIKRAVNHFCSMRCSGDFKKKQYLGKNNPNSKYDYDETIFDEINDEFKAWFLGWVLSDGAINENGNISIFVDKKDEQVLKVIQNTFCKEIPITKKTNTNLVGYTVSSKRMMKRVQEIIGVADDVFAISNNMNVINGVPEEMAIHFVRGYFEGDGSIRDILNGTHKIPECKVTSNSLCVLEFISENIDIPFSIYLDNHSKNTSYNLCYYGVNALDFLGRLYNKCNYSLLRKKEAYWDICMWDPTLKNTTTHVDNIKVSKTHLSAVIPSKNNVSDSGYDLTIIEKVKTDGRVEMFDTGIKVEPPFGYYFDLVPRSSITKSGYILANSVGVIDRSYTGSIRIPLIKIDDSKPDMVLPCRIGQLVLRPVVHFEVVEIDAINETSRSEGGFGSSDLKLKKQ